MASVTISSIDKNYGAVSVLKNVSLEVEDGDFAVIVGPSGCGKSTLLRVIAGLEEHQAGDLLIGERNVNRVPPAERGVGMLFQSYALFPHLNVERNISFGMRMRGEPKDEVASKVAEAARILKLEPYMERLPKHLSGGQRQRVAIGRAIVRNPQVFLFDEPLSNLDAELRVEMRLELAKLHRSLRATMIFVTHDQIEAMTLGTKIIIMHDGIVQQSGTPLEVYYKPANKFVAGFIGSPRMQFLPGEVLAATDGIVSVRVDGVTPPIVEVACDGSDVSEGDKVDIGIRPEDLHLSAQGHAHSLVVMANAVEYMGNASFLYGTAKHGDNTLIAHLDRDEHIVPDSEVALCFDPANVYLFDSNGLALTRLNVANKNLDKQQADAQARTELGGSSQQEA